MNKPSLPPDDLPPSQVTYVDEMLLKNLDTVVGQHFYASCNRIIQVLLSNSQWCLKSNSRALTLIIQCPDREMYWHICNAIPDIAKKLQHFSPRAKIRLFPPLNQGTPWEIRVSEVSIYKRWFH